MTKPQLYVICGPSGAGKTSYATQLSKKIKDADYIPIDYLYRQSHINTAEKRKRFKFDIWIMFMKEIRRHELHNRSLIIETCCPTTTSKLQFIEWFPGFEHHFIYIEASKQLCMRNNASRPTHKLTNEELFYNFRQNKFDPAAFKDPRWKSAIRLHNIGNKKYHIISQKGQCIKP